MAARGRRRAGLAPLELVLALPIMLFLMALMINFGTVASWKVRMLAMARDAAWQGRASRGGYSYLPEGWPETASAGVGELGRVAELDDPRVDHPVARGPLPYGAAVNSDRLDPTLELRQGSAAMTRDFPLLATMGAYRLEANTYLLDNKWQFREMGISANTQLRIPALYQLPTAPPEYGQAYVDAAGPVYEAAFWPELFPLDRDEETHYRYDETRGLIRYRPMRDFYPGLGSFCSLDRSDADRRVEDLINRIRGSADPDVAGVPEEMTTAWIGWYRSDIRALRQAWSPDSPPPAVQAEIDELEGKIDVLTEYLGTL